MSGLTVSFLGIRRAGKQCVQGFAYFVQQIRFLDGGLESVAGVVGNHGRVGITAGNDGFHGRIPIPQMAFILNMARISS